MKKLCYILFFFTLCHPELIEGQTNGTTQNNTTKDSIKQLLKTAKHDTIKLRLLNEMVEAEADNKICAIYNEQLNSTAEKLLTTKPNAAILKIAKKYLAASLNNNGFFYMNYGDIHKALEYYGKSLQLQEEILDKQGAAYSLNNIGLIYYNQGDIPEALEYFWKSLSLHEKIGDKQGIANSLNNIGAIYYNQGDIPKTLEYFGKSLKLREEIGDKHRIANSLINIGNIYQKHGDPSVTSSKEDALKAGIPKALEYYNKSLQIQEKIGDKYGIANALMNLGSVYISQHQLTKAKSYLKKAYQLSKELGYPELIEEAASGLNRIYEQQGNYKLAYHYHQEEIQMRDSIQSEENYKASVQQRAKYEYEKKAATDSIANVKEKEIKNSEIAQQKAEIKAKRFQQYGLISGLAIVLIFAGFVYNRLKITQQQKCIIETQKTEVEQQKQLVEKQKEVVEEKQKEILDSIRYAKRIQDALLTSQSYIERNIKRLKK